MKKLYPDLWISQPEFPNEVEEPKLMMHGFLLTRPEGNFIISRLDNEFDLQVIQKEGGAIRQFITHWHEASFGLGKNRSKFNSQLWCHKLAVPKVSLFALPDRTFNQDEFLFNNFKMIHTPGHTPGSCVFYYQSPYGKKYLFVGDTVCKMEGKWGTVIVDESNIDDLRNSIEILHGLKPDIVLMGVTVDELSYIEMNEVSWEEALVEAAANPLDLRHYNDSYQSGLNNFYYDKKGEVKFNHP